MLERSQTIDQIGFLVHDLDAAVHRWTAHSRVGPWTIFRSVVLDGHFRGIHARQNGCRAWL
jgi:hypothetical protein